MTLVISHRGSGGPDNSLEAFERAIALGADMIEFDIRRSSDGELVLLHDEKIDGDTVASLSSDEISQRLDREVMRLGQLIELAEGKIGLNAEIKVEGIAEEVVAAFQDFDRPLIISSFQSNIIREIKHNNDQIATGLVSAFRSYPSEELALTRADYLIAHFTMPAAIARSRDYGIPLIGWTINNRRRLNRWINQEPGVYGVITDETERALRLRIR